MKFNKSSLMTIALAGTFSIGHAMKITGIAPTIKVVDPVAQAGAPQFETEMNKTLKSAFDTTLGMARDNLAGFAEQKELAQGFGNANAYSMNSATLQGFQNYSLFAVATGLMVGVQAPSTSVSYYSKIGDDIQKKGDLYAGLGAGFSYLNVGINAGFIHPGLYLNAKYGAMNQTFGDFKMNFSVMGLGFNYRLLDTKSLIGLVKWRGISIGSGFYMQSDKLNIHITSDSINTTAPFRKNVLATANSAPDSLAKGALMDRLGYTTTNPDAQVVLVPGFDMGLKVSTMTIPFDAVTAVSVLFGLINITAGAGFDLNFGSNKVVLEGGSDASIASDTTKIKFTKANMVIDGSSSNGPSFARFRVMTGAGIGLGPVKLDIPVIYYPASGMAIGLTAAIVW